MKNKEFVSLYKTLFLVFIVSVGISIIYSFTFKVQINNYGYNITSNVVGNILDKHPELEEEVIKSLNDNKNFNLEKYGITKNNLDSLEGYFDDTEGIFKSFYVFLFVGFLVITAIYFLYLVRFYFKLQEVSKYIKDILCNRCINSFKDYDEGIFSILKNDISKVAIELVRSKENLEKDKKYLEETLSDISHQLKTPLTSMYMINDILYNNKIDDRERCDFLERNRRQLERIEWLVTSLLKLSKLESGTIKLKKEEVLAKKLVEDSFAPLRIPYELKKQDFKIEVRDNCKIVCDYNWTREAIINILKNAHEHTLEGGKVEVLIDSNPIFTSIAIKDNGCGISNADIRHVFERFYRGETGSKDSVGIGLNMAKNVIERENGVIEVESKENEGTTFTIKFYKIDNKLD